MGGKYLDMQGRYMLAMALSRSPVLEEFEKALGEMVSMRAVLQAAIGTVVTLLVLLALPEPITKFVAAWATAALVLWVGAKTLYNLESVAVTPEGFSVALAPGAVAMAARGGRGDRTEKHHIGTIANKKSSLRGGPWTPRFEKLFARAGMRLKDPENIVPIQGHKGPHPQRYHDIVYERLQEALGDCRAIAECRAELTRELRSLAEEIATPGTELNRLVTLGK